VNYKIALMGADFKTYDRQLGETEKAYAAFCLYRDLGVDRSLVLTEKKYYAAVAAQKGRITKNIRQIQLWSARYQWVSRVLDYDRDQQSILREHTTRKNIEEHDRELEQFRQSNKAMGSALMAMGARLMKIGDRVARNIENKEEITAADLDTFLKLPASVKAIANFATIGGDLTADGLLIRQMLEKMKGEGE
jgi:hypothetical protein